MGTPYDEVAGTYYDPWRLACRNFDEATRAVLPRPRLGDGRRQGPPVLEVGCGRGRCGEYMGLSPGRVVQLDLSLSMLLLPDREPSLGRVQADAERLPFASASFCGVAGFLADPFVGRAFLSEAFRVLAPGGWIVLTMPSAEWGFALRERSPRGLNVARFKVSREEERYVDVPSRLLDDRYVADLLAWAGFARPMVTRHRLPSREPVSRDVRDAARAAGVEPAALEILYVAGASKPGGPVYGWSS